LKIDENFGKSFVVGFVIISIVLAFFFAVYSTQVEVKNISRLQQVCTNEMGGVLLSAGFRTIQCDGYVREMAVNAQICKVGDTMYRIKNYGWEWVKVCQ